MQQLDVCVLLRSRWQRVTSTTQSLWMDLFTATASLGRRKPASHRAQIFGCGRMTLAQRAAVPLAVRRSLQDDPLSDMRPLAVDTAQPLTVSSFLRGWLVRHGEHLRKISLAGCGAWVQDADVQMLANSCASTLICLDLCGCAHLSDEGVAHILQKCQNLSQISLAMMGQLSSAAVEPLAHRAAVADVVNNTDTADKSCLQAIDLTGCGGLMGQTLVRALRGTPGLTELSLRGHVSMPATNFLSAVNCCTKLQRLDVSCCLCLDDATVCQLASLCPQLQTLAMSACPAVTMSPSTVRTLAQGCGRRLRALSLAGCLELCPHESMLALISQLPALELLDLSHCTQIQPMHVAAALGHIDTVANRSVIKASTASKGWPVLTMKLPQSADPHTLQTWQSPPSGVQLLCK